MGHLTALGVHMRRGDECLAAQVIRDDPPHYERIDLAVTEIVDEDISTHAEFGVARDENTERAKALGTDKTWHHVHDCPDV